MKDNYKTLIIWIISILFAVGFYFYQRWTGPTYPVHGNVTVNKEEISYSLPRSHPGDGNAELKIKVKDPEITGYVIYKRFKSFDTDTRFVMERKGEELTAELPHQPMAGKIIYSVYLSTAEVNPVMLTEEPVIIRFRGDVPNYIIVPHIIFIFFALLFSTRTGIEALMKRDNIFKLSIWTIIFIFWGGLVLGPIMQKYAFDAYWTGWPFGHDLTDNKTAGAFIIWAVALWRISVKPEQKWWALIAAIVTLAVFMVPHSILGSEIDHTKMVN